MNASLTSAVSAERGAFVVACMVHVQSIFCPGGGGWSWKVAGVTLAEAFSNYYFRRPGPSQLFDGYGYPSNPMCAPPAPSAYPGWCSFGILHQDGKVCCDAKCGQCGGSGCGNLPGGSSRCCTGKVAKLGRPCADGSDVACVVPDPGPVSLIADREHEQHFPWEQTSDMQIIASKPLLVEVDANGKLHTQVDATNVGGTKFSKRVASVSKHVPGSLPSL